MSNSTVKPEILEKRPHDMSRLDTFFLRGKLIARAIHLPNVSSKPHHHLPPNSTHQFCQIETPDPERNQPETAIQSLDQYIQIGMRNAKFSNQVGQVDSWT
ncbi:MULTISPECIES: hypothetical protein [Hyphomicrobiales]|jgi:hypothetical protein|uniref:hypothetical protein n=1 Tax=Methylobacterium sp. CCH7-A2 TaxID=1768789 RepID=UPI0012E38A94|nr:MULTISPECIES: hypothetical protein [Hyphomicrobiales]